MQHWQEDSEATDDELKSVAGCGILSIALLLAVVLVALWLLLKLT